MNRDVKLNLESIFHQLVENKRLIIPDRQTILHWDNIVKEWVADDSMTLFARKGSVDRGTPITIYGPRKIITTDNTPAHWVFKKVVLDKGRFTKSEIAGFLTLNKFPISFVRKKSERKTLTDEMVADKTIKLSSLDFKLAHIDGIAMKRGKNVTLQDVKDHHIKFLSLSNMYIIDKNLSGLAEVKLFNDILKNHIQTDSGRINERH